MYSKTMSLIKHDTLLKELNELKSLVGESKLYKFEEEISRFSDMYKRELINCE